MNRRLLHGGAFLFCLLTLPASSGALELEVRGRGSSSGEGDGGVIFKEEAWTLFGFFSLQEEEFSPENFGIEIPWGGVGSWDIRGVLKELELPSLSRKPQEGQSFFPRLIKGHQAGSRWGLLAASPHRSWGALGWIRRERPSLGGWSRWTPAEGVSLSLGGLLQDVEAAEEEGWLLEEPPMASPWRTALGLEFLLDRPRWELFGGGYCTGGPGDPPGGWLRGYILHRGEELEASLGGGLSSDRVGTSDGDRLTEALHYDLEATLFPRGLFRGRVGFGETHYHPSLLFRAFRAYRTQGTVALLFSPRRWEAKAEMGRKLTGDESGNLTLKDRYGLSLDRRSSRWNLSLEYRLEGEGEEWLHRGELGAGLTGGEWSFSTQGRIDHREGRLGGRVGGEISLWGKRWRSSLEAQWDWPIDEPAEFKLSLEFSFTPLK